MTLTDHRPSASPDDGRRGPHVRRSVRSQGPAHVIELSRTFAAAPAALWSAVTDPDHLGRWFGCLQGRLQRGGSYRLPDMGISGRIVRGRAPHRVELTWELGHELSELALTVEAVDAVTASTTDPTDGSRLTLQHTVPATDDWALFGPAAVGIGWDTALLNLARHLEDPAAEHLAGPSDVARTEDGRAFVRASAAAWERAHLATGADPGFARDAARRTAEYHLGRH